MCNNNKYSVRLFFHLCYPSYILYFSREYARSITFAVGVVVVEVEVVAECATEVKDEAMSLEVNVEGRLLSAGGRRGGGGGIIWWLIRAVPESLS
uniref:Uncharacterized protein n=1 Tax=Melicertus latisulcatus pemonivirus TaxID=2984278 RepID=A0A9C7BZE8_9VIRU|nr:MAG: hypothetical protein [Melicertus latisulcatus pemonivirus]